MADPTSSSGSIGAGQYQPEDGNSDFMVMTFIIRRMMAKLDTMKLVQVVAVHGGGETAPPPTVDVQLLIKQIDGSGNATPHGVVYGIPVWRAQGGDNAIVLDPKKGDIGYVDCSDRDISSLKAAAANGNAGQVTPGSNRRYNIADGVYVGGTLNKKPVQYVLFTDDTIKVVDKTGNVVLMSSTGIELTPKSGLPVKVNGNLIVTENFQLGGTIQAQPGGTYGGDIVTTGNIISNGVGLTTHTHTQAPDSHGDVEEPTGPGAG